MRSLFASYYRPKPAELAEKFKQCVFVFDTNVLCHLYRYTPESRDALLKALNRVKGRAWLPHRVAFEYQRQRTDRLLEQIGLYDKIARAIGEAVAKIEGLARQSTKFTSDVLIAPVKEELEKVKAGVLERKPPTPDLMDGDPIWDALTELFDDCVGPAYTTEREEELFKEGKERYDKKIPPGFKDKNKNKDPDSTDRYGDLLVWFQLIDYARTEERPIIFVTDDNKEDWWHIEGDQTLGPRMELKEEYRQKAGEGKWFYLYDTDTFLKHANQYLDAEIPQKAIDEAEEIKRQNVEAEKAREGVLLLEDGEPLLLQNQVPLAAAGTQASVPLSVLADVIRIPRQASMPLSALADLTRAARQASVPPPALADFAWAAKMVQIPDYSRGLTAFAEQMRQQQAAIQDVMRPVVEQIQRSQAAIAEVTRPFRDVLVPVVEQIRLQQRVIDEMVRPLALLDDSVRGRPQAKGEAKSPESEQPPAQDEPMDDKPQE